MLYFLPIEPIEERYSIQWSKWFKEAFNKNHIEHIDYEIIDPPSLMNNLGNKSGEVLNIYNTNYYKSIQMCELTKFFQDGKIKDGDSIFLMDAWNPVIEQLEYIRKISKIDFKICGMLHAGCWDPNDFLNRYEFQNANVHLAEKSWLTSLDEIYVASDFHRGLIMQFHSDLAVNFNLGRKIKIVNFPLKLDYSFFQELKEDLIVFPHRLDSEKRPELFDQFKEYYNETGKHKVNFLKTKEHCTNKESFYDILKRAKIAISFAQQETFGIAMLESCVHGCLPLVPDNLSYKEMYPDIFQYNSRFIHTETRSEFYILKNKIDYMLDNFNKLQYFLPSIVSPYYNSCEEIITYAESIHLREREK